MSNQPQVTLAPLEPDDKEQFILDNQWAFKYGATEEFGARDEHFEKRNIHFYVNKCGFFQKEYIPDWPPTDLNC